MAMLTFTVFLAVTVRGTEFWITVCGGNVSIQINLNISSDTFLLIKSDKLSGISMMTRQLF